MDVQAAFGGQIQHPLRQDQTVGGHDHHVRLRIQQSLACRRSILRIFAVQTQAHGLFHANAMSQCALLDGRSLQFHAATGRAIRLGQYQRHVKTCLQQALQGYTRKLGRASKNDFHVVYPKIKRPPWRSAGAAVAFSERGRRARCAVRR